jgi:hypothetical protein
LIIFAGIENIFWILISLFENREIAPLILHPINPFEKFLQTRQLVDFLGASFRRLFIVSTSVKCGANFGVDLTNFGVGRKAFYQIEKFFFWFLLLELMVLTT